MKRLIFSIIFINMFHMAEAQVEIIAHRGASYLAPENTVAASRLAWELGSDAVECDIYLSKDNKIMSIHDANTLRTTGRDYTVKDTDSDILRTLDAGAFKGKEFTGEKIPFLEEIIQVVPEGKELVVELKCGPEVLPYLKKVIKKHGKNKRFVFIAFNLNTITETKKAFPRNPCYWLCSNKDLLEQNFPEVKKAGLEGVSLMYRIIDNDVMNIASDLGLEVFTWTVNDTAEAKRLISLGVKGITTDRPGWLRDQIE